MVWTARGRNHQQQKNKCKRKKKYVHRSVFKENCHKKEAPVGVKKNVMKRDIANCNHSKSYQPIYINSLYIYLDTGTRAPEKSKR